MLDFRLLLPPRTVFGWSRRHCLGSIARELGKQAILICGSRTLQRSAIYSEIHASLRESKVDVAQEILVTGEPTIADVDSAVESIRNQAASSDLVIGIGGGAAIDFAKAVAAMTTNRHGESIRDFLEGVGCGLTLDSAPLPILAVPTTSGTGSEATKNAVISVDDPPVKKSLRSEQLIPRAVVIDPELTVTNSPEVTAHSGMDAITQLIESFLCRKANRLTQALCLDGLQLAATQLERAYQQPDNRDARSAMSYAAYLSGIALANSGLGMAHGVAAALGAICHVPHGLACAALLPVALEVNRDCVQPQLATLERHLSSESRQTDADAALAFQARIESLCETLGIPRRLRDLGVQQHQLAKIVFGSRGNSMNGNPRELTDQELTSILEARW